MPRKKTEKVEELKAEELNATPEVEESDEIREEAAETANEKPAAEQAVRRPSRYGNRVVLKGQIVKKTVGAKVTVIVLRTRATATVANYPSVFFFNPVAERCAEFKEGDRVEIMAHLNSYDAPSRQRRQEETLVVGSSIVRDETAPEIRVSDDDGLAPIEKPYIHDENHFEFKGQIKAIEIGRDNNITLTIYTWFRGRNSVIKFPYIARNINAFLREIHVNEYVTALGTIQTTNVPVEPEPNAAQKAETTERAASLRGRPENRIRTRKQQYYILYDIYVAAKNAR